MFDDYIILNLATLLTFRLRISLSVLSVLSGKEPFCLIANENCFIIKINGSNSKQVLKMCKYIVNCVFRQY